MPIIGLLSDSHGRATTTQQAVDLLIQHGAEQLIHLGDVGTVEVIDALVTVPPDKTKPLPVHLVFGNTDWDVAHLGEYAAGLGVHVAHPVGRIEFDGREMIYLHGDDNLAMRHALDRKPAWLCHGHTHRSLDRRQGSTRLINPGALFRASTYTVALLETANDNLKFLRVGPAGT